jgi:hypothetical protein
MNQYPYFTEIEETFVRRRGRHLMLSSKDWVLIESWKDKGIPLHVAIRAIEAVFDDSDRRRGSVTSLAYCSKAVDADFAEWSTAQVGASSEEPEAANYDAWCICGKQFCLDLHRDDFFSA